jgi:hypothetical protein
MKLIIKNQEFKGIMDIKTELMQIESDNSSIDKLVQDIEFQENELLKKAHILKIVALANKIESMIKTDLFTEYKVDFLEIYWENLVGSDKTKLGFCILDKNKQRLPPLNGNHGFIKPFAAIMKETDKLGFFKQSFLKEDALELKPQDMIIELKLGIKDKLLNVLLSNELKKVLEYNKMQLEVPNNNESNSKKLKM